MSKAPRYVWWPQGSGSQHGAPSNSMTTWELGRNAYSQAPVQTSGDQHLPAGVGSAICVDPMQAQVREPLLEAFAFLQLVCLFAWFFLKRGR